MIHIAVALAYSGSATTDIGPDNSAEVDRSWRGGPVAVSLLSVQVWKDQPLSGASMVSVKSVGAPPS